MTFDLDTTLSRKSTTVPWFAAMVIEAESRAPKGLDLARKVINVF